MRTCCGTEISSAATITSMPTVPTMLIDCPAARTVRPIMPPIRTS